MKNLSVLGLFWLLIPFSLANSSNQSNAEMFSSKAEQCIAVNSGAASLVCLENLYQTANQQLNRLNDLVLSKLDERKAQSTITQIHFDSASQQFKRSVLDFRLYRDSSCAAVAGYSGAAASGHGQVLYSCLIQQTDERCHFLLSILNRK